MKKFILFFCSLSLMAAEQRLQIDQEEKKLIEGSKALCVDWKKLVTYAARIKHNADYINKTVRLEGDTDRGVENSNQVASPSFFDQLLLINRTFEVIQSPDHKLIAHGTNVQGGLSVINIYKEDGTLLKTMDIKERYVGSFTFSPDSSKLVVPCTFVAKVKLFNIIGSETTPYHVIEYDGYQTIVPFVACSNNFITVNYGNEIAWYDFQGNKVHDFSIGTSRLAVGSISPMKFSPDGTIFITIIDKNKHHPYILQLWNAETKKLIKKHHYRPKEKLRYDPNIICIDENFKIIFSPYYPMFAMSIFPSKEVTLFDLSGTVLARLLVDNDAERIINVDFTLDGNQIVAQCVTYSEETKKLKYEPTIIDIKRRLQFKRTKKIWNIDPDTFPTAREMDTKETTCEQSKRTADESSDQPSGKRVHIDNE